MDNPVKRLQPDNLRPDADMNRDRLEHAVYDGQNKIGWAASFKRRVKASDGSEFDILTLGGLHVREEVRGKGLGSLLVRDVFTRMAEENIAACLFQNKESLVPLYRRCGAVVEHQAFFNSASPDKPLWWDEVIMRYPADFTWPDGPVDLRGPAF